MIHYDKAIVASGHQLVSEAAATILREGGNAFDAVTAAGFASAVVEHTLNSLGGGGFLIGHSTRRGQNLFFDFFVDTPGRGSDGKAHASHFFPVTIQFSGAPQEFNIGLGSVAVPGTAKGLLHVHRRLGRMALKDVVSPAVDYARGHTVNRFQADFMRILKPIWGLSPTGRALCSTGEDDIKQGERQKNRELADFLLLLVEDDGESFYRGDIAQAIVAEMREKGGLLTGEDLARYRVIERKPIRVGYRDYQFFTSPPPSMGGSLIALSLSLYSACDMPDFAWGGREYLLRTLAVMREVERLRQAGITSPAALKTYLQTGIAQSLDNIRLFSGGTTHISVADREGNCAGMTCSNGEGSGYFAPGTGVMLNNMMGEDDLHPLGFHLSPPGQRVCSMMSPSMLLRGDQVKLVIGSGGSKRIRTAITQVLHQVVDFGRELNQAVAAPRLHLEDRCLQVEPGFAKEALEALDTDMNVWDVLDVYFGGVHAVIPGREGAGDPRRGGHVIEV
jgi:gamma-glutamyltranspeptidase/glutathione hydrolase